MKKEIDIVSDEFWERKAAKNDTTADKTTVRCVDHLHCHSEIPAFLHRGSLRWWDFLVNLGAEWETNRNNIVFINIEIDIYNLRNDLCDYIFIGIGYGIHS